MNDKAKKITRWAEEPLYRKKLYEMAGLDGPMLYNAGVQLSDERLERMIKSKALVNKKTGMLSQVKDIIMERVPQLKLAEVKQWFHDLKVVRIYRSFDELDKRTQLLESQHKLTKAESSKALEKANRAANALYRVTDPHDEVLRKYVERLRLVREEENGPLVIRGLTTEQLREEKAEEKRIWDLKHKKEAEALAKAKGEQKVDSDFEGVAEMNTPMSKPGKPDGNKKLQVERVQPASKNPDDDTISSGTRIKTPNLDTSKDGYGPEDSPFS